MPLARLIAALALGLCALTPVPARGEAPADPLLRLVPADAAVTVAVEDLRGHALEFAASSLADGLRKLPAVRDWLDSDRPRGLGKALKKAEAALGENLSAVRDGLLGEAVVLALRLPPGGRPEDARGLLLVRVPDRALLDRMVAGLNAAQTKSGELLRVGDRTSGETAYHVREFRAGGRDSEYYASLDDRVFAWSNSEDLIRKAIDLQANPKPGGSLAGLADFRRVRDRLPRRAVASLYVDPRFIERMLAASPKSQNTADEKAFAMLTRYLGAVRFAGAALEWRNGLVLHSEEIVDPAALSPGLRRWAARTDTPDAASRRVPRSALLMATAHVDFGVLFDGLLALAPEPDGPKVENLRAALNGLLLGLDARSEVAPQLGPGGLVYVERPDGDGPPGRLPAVLSIEIGRGDKKQGAKTAAAVDNALRTFLAVYALDDAHGGGRLRVVSRTAGGATITSLSAESPFAYAARDGRLVVGTDAGAVGRALIAATDPHGADRVERVRSAYFPDSVSFALADLRGVHDFTDRRRPDLARHFAARQHLPESEAARDLDQALALIDLFDAAFFTTTVAADFSGVHRAVGLVRLTPVRP